MKALALGLLLLGPLPAGPAEKIPPPAERPAEKPGDRTPSIAERAKDLARHEGFLPFYWDARKGQLLLDVSRWNEDFLYGAGLAGGAGLLDVSLDRGQLGDLGICRFERAGPRVLLHQKPRAGTPGVPLRARGRPHDRPDAQLGRDHIRLGLGDGLPRAERPGERRQARGFGEPQGPPLRSPGHTPGEALTLDALLARLVLATWGAPPDASPRREALRRIAQRGVLDAMMDLAARTESAAEVRAAVHSRLARLKNELRGRHSTDVATEAHLRLAEGDLSEFLEKPEVRRARPPRPAAPPGRPFGE